MLATQPRARPRSVVIVYKKSLWTLKGRSLQARFLPLDQQQRWRRSHEELTATFRQVIRVLREEQMVVRLCYRARLEPIRRASIVISLGGDGTFLNASHNVQDTPVFGVNSDPSTSVGFYCCASRENFRAHFRAFLRGALPVVPLMRLQARLNDRALPQLILNDCLMTHRNPAATSRYLLRVRGREELQASSGLWVATPSGSTAAARAAGGYILPLLSRQFEFVVREPFVRGVGPVRMWRGRVPSTAQVRVVSLMPAGMLYLDGPHVAYPFRWGDRVTFCVGTPLRAVGVRRSAVFGQEGTS